MPGSGNSSISSAQDGPQETIIPVDKLRFNSKGEILGETADKDFSFRNTEHCLGNILFP